MNSSKLISILVFFIFTFVCYSKNHDLSLLPKNISVLEVYENGLGSPIGEIQEVNSTAFIIHFEDQKAYLAKNNYQIFEKDTIITEGAGGTKILLVDGSILTLAPNSKILITKSLFDSSRKQRNIFIQVFIGKIRFFVQKLNDYNQSEFNVNTPTATSGVRGSDFIVNAFGELTEFIALSNTKIEVKSLKFPDNPVILNDFEKSIVKQDMLPSEIKKISPEEVKTLLNDFEIAVGIGLSAVPALPISLPVAKTGKEFLEITKTNPEKDQIDVQTDTKVKIDFSEPVDKSSVTKNNFFVSSSTKTIDGDIKVENNSIIFISKDHFQPGEMHSINIKKEVLGQKGNYLENDIVISFRTKKTEKFDLIFAEPKKESTRVSINKSIEVTFNKEPRPESLNENTFWLTSKGSSVPGEIIINGSKVVFKPTSPLEYISMYQLNIKKDITSLTDETLEKEHLISFTTENKKRKSIILEIGDLVTLGKFTVKETSLDINKNLFNPTLSIEYLFSNNWLSLGVEYSKIKNKISGEYAKNDNEKGEGSYNVERKEGSIYIKYMSSPSFNMKTGICFFDYAFKDGEIEIKKNENLFEHITEMNAEADMKKGLMAELNYSKGNVFQFSFGLQYKYFFSAEYSLKYNREIIFPNSFENFNETARLSVHSARVRPEISFLPTQDMRLFLNLTLAASYWTGEDSSIFDDLKFYPGVDIYTGIGAGIRLYF